MQFTRLIENDIFPIPVGMEFGKAQDELNIVYSPLTDRAILVTKEYLTLMEQYLSSPKDREKMQKDVVEAMSSLLDFENRKKPAPLAEDPDAYTRIAILPNNVCNFKCSYCYSAHGRSGKIISKEMLKAGLDHFINNERVSIDNKLAISILGGGEPMLSWDLVRFIIEYSNERSSKMGFCGIDINLLRYC
ncbi:MAG: hypothetical protein ACI30C_08975, partial [Muribaculaceae bacterium]